MKILVTGFEPFGGQTVNSSGSAVAMLPQTLGGHTIETMILPVSYTRSDKLLLERIRAISPDAVICVGQNAGCADIRVESTAGNYAHSESEDNDHNLWLYRSIDMSGAPSYRSTLPIEAIVKNLHAADIPAEVSHSAGTFVCNCLMYQLLRASEADFPTVPCGFIHVPALPEQCAEPEKEPNMSASQIAKALSIAIATVIEPDGDGVLDVAEVPAETPAAEAVETAVEAIAEPVVEAVAETVAEAAEAVTEPVAEPVVVLEAAAEVAAEAASEVVPEAVPEVAPDVAPVAAESAPENAQAEGAHTMSAAQAAAQYFRKIRTEKEKLSKAEEEAYLYYNGSPKRTDAASDGTKTGDVLRRISGSVPEKIEYLGSEAPRETLFAPAQERYKVDTNDYRVFSVKEKYRPSEPDGTPVDKMTLTEYMDTFIPERKKTLAEIKEEERRTLIHKTDSRDKRSYAEREELRKAAAEKEAQKPHEFYGDLFVMSDTMRAMGKTLNKNVMIDGDIHLLLFTSIEENGNIVAYKIREQETKANPKGRPIGVLPTYAAEYENYYLFFALTENKKIVCDPDTYEIRLEDYTE
ncbi:MAG: hypothetical protein J5645_04295 [Lachnospiraceae bacterium]|nr:hypothetical protein [Lachnospiraceae bacterium]